MINPDITIIVSSCDAYADCWEPFFKLFEIFWPDCPYPIILITEKKYYEGSYKKVKTFPALIVSGKKKLEWGGRMIECLHHLDSKVVLYLQEDFFLKDKVDQKLIAEFADFMVERSWANESTMHVGLSPRSSHGPFHLTEHPMLWEVDRQARYRFSLLPGLWVRLEILKYLKYRDSAWDFEESSHVRGRRTPNRILTVDRHLFRLDGKQIYPFDASGIERGRWVRHNVVRLFEKHGIKVDFSQRGFIDERVSKKDSSLWLGLRIWYAVILRFKSYINKVIDSVRS